MADVAVVSANYGNFDEFRPQAAQDIDVDWIMFTDGPGAPEPWRTVVNTHGRIGAVRAAKWFKCVLPVEHRYVVWIDANMEVTAPSFVREALECLHDGIALFAHPRRDCIYEEAEASLGSESQNGKYVAEPIMQQVGSYREEYPEHGGLYACGTIAWDRSDERARKLGFAWYAECLRWSIQDQLSFPVVCRRMGIEPGVFPFRQLERGMSNRWLTIHPHL